MPIFTSAQKAYKAVQYKASFDAHKFQLILGDGYLAASKIKMWADGKPAVFYPDTGMPDDKDQLIFHAKEHDDYFILNDMEEHYDDAPKIVVGRYWTDKRWRIIKFVLSR